MPEIPKSPWVSALPHFVVQRAVRYSYNTGTGIVQDDPRFCNRNSAVPYCALGPGFVSISQITASRVFNESGSISMCGYTLILI